MLAEVTAGERQESAMDVAARLTVSYILVYITRKPSIICPHQVYTVDKLIPVDQIHALFLLRTTKRIVGPQRKYKKLGPYIL